MAKLGVRLVDSTSGGISVHPSSVSFFVIEVKEGHQLDPLLMELKDSVFVQMNEYFVLGDDDIHMYQDMLCVPYVDDLRTRIIAKTHSSRYFIHLGSTKRYHNLKQNFWWDGMKKDIADYVDRCHNYQRVKAEHVKLVSLNKIIEIQTSKQEAINIDFVVGLLNTRRQRESIWVIVDRLLCLPTLFL